MKKSLSLISCILVCFISLMLLVSCGNTENTSLNNDTTTATNEKSQENAEVKTDTTKKNYKTKIEWADLSSYCCAVEVDDYDGDVIESGTYRIYPDLVSGLDKGRIAIVWDIYVSNNLYNNISELKDSEYKGSVGGISKNEISLDLSANQYLYVKYNAVANNNPTGIIVIKKK